MDRILFAALLILTGLLASCGGSADNRQVFPPGSEVLPMQSPPGLDAVEVFRASLPMEGSFNATRVPAVSQLSQAGSQFSEASDNVSMTESLAVFAGDGGIEYAIWRFNGTVEDSVGQVDVALESASGGSRFWVAVADYSSGRWDWRGSASDGADFADSLEGSPGQHSSPAGYIYVAVLSDTDNSFSVESVTIEYLDRFDVSGFVLDLEDKPIAGAFVTTNLEDPQVVVSGPDGSFSLSGIPNGNWAVMATKQGFRFWPAATMVEVNDAKPSDVVLRGDVQISQLDVDDIHEPNDYFGNRYPFTGTSLDDASISIIDDPLDYYSFDIITPGWYYLQFMGDESILFPGLQLYVDEEIAAFSSDYVLYGANWVGYYFSLPGQYHVEVGCQAGGGEYSLEILPGRTQQANVQLWDNGGAGDGDDGLRDSLLSNHVLFEFPGFSSMLTSAGSDEINHDHIPPLQATITPQSEFYTFTPASTSHDFSTGELAGFNFNIDATAPVDDLEPNDDIASATELSLPLDGPVQSWIGGNDLTGDDEKDFYSFSVQEGRHVMARVRFPDNAPENFDQPGNLTLRDASEAAQAAYRVSPLGLEIRSNNPLTAGTYSLELYMEGNAMPYELEIYEYEALNLSVLAEIEGQPLRGTELSATFSGGEAYAIAATNTAGQAELNIPFMPGEWVLVSYERFGISFDPPEELLQFSDSDILLTPAAAYDTDNWEPNDNAATAPVFDMPVQLTATISEDTDRWDYYKVNVDDPLSIEISYTLSSQELWMETTVYDSSLNSLIYQAGRGDHSVFLPLGSGQQLTVWVRLRDGGEAFYDMKIDKAEEDVYSISGTLDNDEAESYLNGFVVNHTSGSWVETTGDDYFLGYYPNGSYDIEWQISNRDVTPSGKTTVVINGSDETVNFSSVYNDYDSLEPNNSGSEAAAVSLPISLSATLDYENDHATAGNDTRDFYEFTAPGDGTIEVILLPWELSPQTIELMLTEGSSGNIVNWGKREGATPENLRLRYEVTAGTSYFIRVESQEDLWYLLFADYL